MESFYGCGNEHKVDKEDEIEDFLPLPMVKPFMGKNKIRIKFSTEHAFVLAQYNRCVLSKM